MLDSVKIYGKTKEQFGWPEDPPEDFSSASVNNVCSPNLNQGNGTSDGDIATPTTTSGSVLERYGLPTLQFIRSTQVFGVYTFQFQFSLVTHTHGLS